MRLRTLDLAPDGTAVVSDEIGAAVPPPEGRLRWIDIAEGDAVELGGIAGRFAFHHLAVENCVRFDARPRLDEFDDHLFVTIHAITSRSGDPARIEVHEVHAFLGARYLVTVHEGSLAVIDEVWDRVKSEPALVKRGVDFVFYQVADAIVDANFPVLDLMAEALEDLEDSVLEAHRHGDLARIFALKRSLVTMRRILSPQRDLLALLAKRGHAVISERNALYFREVYDRLARIHESIDGGRDLIGNVFDAYLSMASNRTNEIMKQLTILSAIFLPLTFLTGFFGQNFSAIPFESATLCAAVVLLTLAIPTGMVLWFRRKGWF